MTPLGVVALVVWVTSLLSVAATAKQRAYFNVTELRVLDMMLKNYDRRATPTFDADTPTEVTVELYIRSFGSINPSTMDYEVDLYLRQYWTDPRLRHKDITTPLDLNDPNLVKAIWKPEVYFPNAKHGEFQFVTVPNVLIRLNPGGKIFYMLRLKLIFACMMEVSKFPLDFQVCTMEIGSFSKTLSELELRWKAEKPVVLYESLKMPQFEFGGVQTSMCEQEQSSSIGDYSCLQAAFTLRRSLGFHLVQSYLPTILIVMISWVSFWMDVDSVPGRVTLGITTLLTMTTKSSGIQAEVPQVSYVKAIDIWMGVCTGFIFAALLEFTLVNYLWRKRPTLQEFQNAISREHEHQDLHDENNWTNVKSKTKHHPHLLFHELQKTESKKQAQKIDEISRIIFPIGFLCFNVAYWPYYML
ncbi:glycine receptor subunit alpha-2-like [Pollicipes pollicipes]|uniref:glycine receptor subunit alpha-2-like n=1 Tax=Pollicipes pollicipes TaxID=41117 RepID=UPI0018851EB0|nr:glycine receptor subunit alpha-2-like [Pollicipes pollicipes]